MNHHQLIKDLIAEIRQLREQIQWANDANYAAECDEARYKKQLRDAEYQRREAESAADYRRYEVEEATHALERARQRGNEYDEQRAIRRLKSL